MAQMKERNNAWGGARPGSGRPPKNPKEKRVQLQLTISQVTRDKLRWAYTYRNIRPGRLVDLLVERHLDDTLIED